jgi:hypothetical protein
MSPACQISSQSVRYFSIFLSHTAWVSDISMIFIVIMSESLCVQRYQKNYINRFIKRNILSENNKTQTPIVGRLC